MGKNTQMGDFKSKMTKKKSPHCLKKKRLGNKKFRKKR